MNEWLEKRGNAAHRRRRIIMNNDGDDAFFAREPTPEAFWAERCHGLEGSQVDTIFYSTTASFDLHNHDSKVAELFDRTEEVLYPRNPAKALVERGHDNLQLIIDFCRKNGMEVFWSLRMNDTHDNWYPYQYPTFKKQHPECLLFQPDDIGKPAVDFMEPHMNATAVDYGQALVRDRQFEIIRDVCERYDVDGIELDFMRGPIFFRPTLEGRPVDAEHAAIMTEFLGRVRAMTEAVGKKRGRPLLVTGRVAATVALNRRIGLDVEGWLANDLIDLVIASLEWWPFTGPAREMVELGHRHGATVYACLGVVMPFTLEGWAGAATNAWQAGVDGIYTFNLFDPHLPHWRVLGEPATLQTVDKVYAVDHLNQKKIRTYEQTVDTADRLPLALAPGETRGVTLPVGEDLATREMRGEIQGPLLTVKVENLTYQDEVEFRLNGEALRMEVVYATEGVSPVACGTFLLKAKPRATAIRQGPNRFEARLLKRRASAAGLPVIVELLLLARLKREPSRSPSP